MPQPFTSRRAFSLIEAAIVLGIVGLVVGGIWAAAASVHAKMKVSSAIEATGHTISRIQSRYKGIDVAGIEYIGSTPELARLLLSPDLADTNGKITPAVGNDMEIMVGQINGSDRALQYIYYGLTLAQCVNLSTSLYNTFQRNQLFHWVHIYTGEASNDNLTSPTQAGTKCAASIADDGEFAKVTLEMELN